jgi:hypothetical protein
MANVSHLKKVLNISGASTRKNKTFQSLVIEEKVLGQSGLEFCKFAHMLEVHLAMR